MVKQTKQQRLANSARERRCIQRKYSNNSSSSHLSLSSRSYNRLDSDTMNQLLMKKNIDRLTSSLPMPIHNDHKRKRYGYTKQQQSNNASAIVAVTDLSMLPFKSYKKHVLWLSASQQDIANYSTASLSRELEYFAEYVKVTPFFIYYNFSSLSLPLLDYRLFDRYHFNSSLMVLRSSQGLACFWIFKMLC